MAFSFCCCLVSVGLWCDFMVDDWGSGHRLWESQLEVLDLEVCSPFLHIAYLDEAWVAAISGNWMKSSRIIWIIAIFPWWRVEASCTGFHFLLYLIFGLPRLQIPFSSLNAFDSIDLILWELLLSECPPMPLRWCGFSWIFGLSWGYQYITFGFSLVAWFA